MLAQAHLDKHIDVIKHKKVYKCLKVTGPDPEKCRNAALAYFEKMGAIELFRFISRNGEVSEFEGLVIVYE